MTFEFFRDLEAAKPAENLVKEYLTSLGLKVEDVSDNPFYYHKGDLKVSLPIGDLFIDVKDDRKIAKTGNVFAEEWTTCENGYNAAGFMHRAYDVLAVVSQEEKKIYFIDFPKLKSFYKKFEVGECRTSTQTTLGYKVPLGNIKAHGAMMGIVCY